LPTGMEYQPPKRKRSREQRLLESPWKLHGAVPPGPNPFENEAPWSAYEIIKAVVVVCWLLPLRLTVFVWCGVLEVAIATLAVTGTELLEDRGCLVHQRPFEWWRRWILSLLSPLNRILLAAAGYWPGCIKVKDYRSAENRRKGTRILVVAPHMTFLDSLLIAWAFPPIPSGVGMTDTLKYPLFRSLTIASQAIFVDRDNPESRQSCKEAIQCRTSEAWVGAPMMIFPEGVLTNGKCLIQFKAGAFTPGVAVTPVCLRHSRQHYNPCGTGKNYRVPLALLRTLLQFANFCEISILDTYVPSEDEAKNPRLFAENVRSTMAKHLQVSVTEHSYDDAFLNFKSRAHIGTDFEAVKMRAESNFTQDDMRRYFRRFEEINVSSSGRVTWHEFEANFLVGSTDDLRLSSDVLQALFSFMDQDSLASIGFRQYVQVIALAQGKLARLDRIRLAFLTICSATSTSDVRARRDVLLQIFGQLGCPTSTLQASSGDLDFVDFTSQVEQYPAVLQAILQKLCTQMGVA